MEKKHVLLMIALSIVFIIPLFPHSFAHKSIDQYGSGVDVQANFTGIQLQPITPIAARQDLTIDYGFVETGHPEFHDEIILPGWNWDVPPHAWPSPLHSSVPAHHYYIHAECEPVGKLTAYAFVYSGGHLLDNLKTKARDLIVKKEVDDVRKAALDSFASEGFAAAAEGTVTVAGATVAVSDVIESLVKSASTVDFGYGVTEIDLNNVPEYSDQTITVNPPADPNASPYLKHDSATITFHLRVIRHGESGCTASDRPYSTVASSYGMIPTWVKNDAAWWSDGSINNQEFATAIGYMVQQRIISANVATNTDGSIVINDNLNIPSWIKNDAKWWSEGSISDTDFTSGIEYMVNQQIISFSEPPSKQYTISKDTLKTLYLESKLYEKDASSLLALNDNQEKVIQLLSTNAGSKNINDQKIAANAKVFEFLDEKQDIDKKSIQQDLDDMAYVSNKIKDLAQKQGVTTYDLDKIIQTLPQNDNSINTSPVNQLKQSADDAKINQGAANQQKDKNDAAQSADDLQRINAALGSNARDESGNENALTPIEIKTKIDQLQSAIDTYQGILPDEMIRFLEWEKNYLNEKLNQSLQTDDEKRKQYILDLMQQAIDILQREQTEQQEETDSILNQISSSGMLELSPEIQNPPQTPSVPSTNLVTPDLQFTVPSQMVREATSSAGATVSFTTPFSSPGANGQVIITCEPSSGSTFPLGNTIVTCTATDTTTQKTLKKTFTVIVHDTTPPAIGSFQPETGPTDDSGAVVYFTISANDLVDGPVTPVCNHNSGDKFPLGVSTITCTAKDSRGNQSTRTLQITITKS